MLYKDIKMKPSQSGLCPPLHLPTLWGILLYCRFLGTARDKPSQELGWISLPARWGAQQPGNTNTSLLLLLKSADNNATLIYFVMLPTFPEEFKWKQEMTKKNSNLHLDRSWVSHHKKVLPDSSSALPQYQRLLRPQKGLPTEVNLEPAVHTITKTRSSTATSLLCNTNVSSTFHRAVTFFSLLGALPRVSVLLKEAQYIQRLWTVSALRQLQLSPAIHTYIS